MFILREKGLRQNQGEKTYNFIVTNMQPMIYDVIKIIKSVILTLIIVEKAH